MLQHHTFYATFNKYCVNFGFKFNQQISIYINIETKKGDIIWCVIIKIIAEKCDNIILGIVSTQICNFLMQHGFIHQDLCQLSLVT